MNEAAAARDFYLAPGDNVNVLPQGRVERCSLYLVAYLSPIAIPETVKTSNHDFSAPFWPESTSQNGLRSDYFECGRGQGTSTNAG
jgi:hypothetical protein